MNWITREIAVGSAMDVQNENRLLQQGVTHVLIVGDIPPQHYQKIIWTKIPWHDQQSLPLLHDALNYIHSTITSGGKILVCCPAGIERSPTTIVAYLTYIGVFQLKDAINLVKSRHRQSIIHLTWLTDLGYNVRE